MAESNHTIRAFIAVRVDRNAAEELKATGDRMADLLPPDIYAKFRPEAGGYHVTLRFIGDVLVDEAWALGIRDPVTGASVEMLDRPFNLSLGGVGCFPAEDEGPPAVLFCKVLGDIPALKDLQAKFENLVKDAGFPPAQYPFNPHITLGRFRDLTEAEGKAARRAVRGSLAPARSPWTVKAVSLLKSVRMMDGGVIYSETYIPAPPEPLR